MSDCNEGGSSNHDRSTSLFIEQTVCVH